MNPAPAAVAAILPLFAMTPAGAVSVDRPLAAAVIDATTRYQRIDGFGISEAFGTANQLRYLGDTPVQRQALDMLFDTSTGAGFSILRNLIPSDPAHTMTPVAPASPSDPPTYVWDGTSDATDWGQLWLAKKAREYGVTRFYNNAWSAPGYMKTNNHEANGGMLCGTPGAVCASGDWRQAYADYLVQHAKNWASVGLTPAALGFVNEPNYVVGYSSMDFTPAQAADFAKVLGPTMRASGLPTRITCCDAIGWSDLPNYTSAVLSDPAARQAVDVFTSHGYATPPDSPVATGRKPVWQTEWSTGRGAFNTAWDDGSTQSGFTWAQNILTGLTEANLNAFLYWWGTSVSASSNSSLILLSGTTLIPAKRYFAFVNFSRFIRPGAVRIGASSPQQSLEMAAFRNVDGSRVVVALNTATTDATTSYRLRGRGAARGCPVTPYLTNSDHDTAVQAPLCLHRGSFTATVPARSLVTYVIDETSR
ncbi:glycoside hydrolase family 30 protein [Actinoplanes derwentensis]|uniref:O-Glycosyl hydrolase n=1 Tax=Actinoplanes derwentensis TaxID=113562 RepID=A0A1H1XFG6_9ACTN|nr:glycoside hydrolase family 30 beta sandwich domain-containing protein [Actinoplanes derwentensis]GID87167.1 xylanase [Actinoplanes derwentensis]SDT07978.1 O-Glycosyl hydrolase [Actinoplanes derwentensis]